MSEPILTAQDVLKWYETTSDHWRKFLAEHPDILAIPCDIANTKTIAEFMQHIVAVELRYAERIAHIPETPYEQVAYDSVEALYATHDRATQILKRALAANHDWSEMIEFQTRSYGSLRASLKTIYFHALLHSLRHYAQLGTLVRQHGYKPTWPGDYLFIGVERV
ncbi:DinB family protein [Edaphobacter bradus]|uniref:DinB family protein n=1 Tax=Edaphobacter bradus TaxID=2259016 RepID=UPI0021DF8269|nr:DinB family protein [Edaphobacter bradus]